MEKHTVFISIGSNMGDRKANCQTGIDALIASGVFSITGLSPFYETEPVDYLDQDWFVNSAMRGETDMTPLELLDLLKTIEARVGRKAHTIRFGPRVLDLDIILYDDLIVNTPRLTIPHVRMHERRFVLKPICDIEPNVVHPILKQTLRQLLAALVDDENQRVVDI